MANWASEQVRLCVTLAAVVRWIARKCLWACEADETWGERQGGPLRISCEKMPDDNRYNFQTFGDLWASFSLSPPRFGSGFYDVEMVTREWCDLCPSGSNWVVSAESGVIRYPTLPSLFRRPSQTQVSKAACPTRRWLPAVGILYHPCSFVRTI